MWEVTAADERSLDRYEGYPVFYRKMDIVSQVMFTSGADGWCRGCAAAHQRQRRCSPAPPASRRQYLRDKAAGRKDALEREALEAEVRIKKAKADIAEQEAKARIKSAARTSPRIAFIRIPASITS